MLVEISGAGFTNKGAQLMLATVCERLRQANPQVQLGIPADYGSYEGHSGYRLSVVIGGAVSWRGPRRLMRDLLSQAVLRTALGPICGLARRRDAEALLDISGYAIGDKWSLGSTHQLARLAASYKRRGKPVVLLPQMLGPFTRRGQARAFTDLSRNVDLMYAREQESFECARPLVAYPEQLRLAPDITVAAAPKAAPAPDSEYICFVPNSKLLESNPHQETWGDSYIERLVLTARHVLRKKISVIVVQHEYGPNDERLVCLLREKIGRNQCKIFQHRDPHVIKGLLGGARLVVGSRFHSLVSSLSMGVPALALGWAHKYDALMRDFGTPHAVHRPSDTISDLTDLVDAILAHRDEHVVAIDSARSDMLLASEEMWRDVLRFIFPPFEDEQRQPDNADIAGSIDC